MTNMSMLHIEVVLVEQSYRIMLYKYILFIDNKAN